MKQIQTRTQIRKLRTLNYSRNPLKNSFTQNVATQLTDNISRSCIEYLTISKNGVKVFFCVAFRGPAQKC